MKQGDALLQMADVVAREKNIDRDEVIHAMEMAVQKLGLAKYGQEHDIRATINRKTGEITIRRYRAIVEELPEFTHEEGELDFPERYILLPDALEIDPTVEVGGFITDDLPPVEFGRIEAQSAKQVIFQKVREAERLHQYNEFKNRIGEVITGIIKRVEFGDVVVDLGRAEAIMRRDETIPREVFRPGDRVRTYVLDVNKEARGHQITLSRSHPGFLAQLFSQEVPEIYDGIIEIKGVARDPGSRAKICVATNDPSIDPVGACVGVRGSRVQAIVTELQGEKIDIIPWKDDIATLIVSALAPAEITKVIVDEDTNRIEVAVPDNQLSIAIGRRGQNVRLASMLLGWDIDILTESEEADKRSQEFKLKTQKFIDCLDIEDVISHLLVIEGYSTISEIANSPIEELASIEGFDESVAQELISRAKDFLDKNESEDMPVIVAHALEDLVGLNAAAIEALKAAQIETLDDFADLSADELIEILPDHGLTPLKADRLIMEARAHWFVEEDEKEPVKADS